MKKFVTACGLLCVMTLVALAAAAALPNYAGTWTLDKDKTKDLPPQMAAICDSNMRMFDLGAKACIERSKEAAIHSLMLDPLTAAVCTPAQIKSMTLEMFEAEKDFLPGYR